MDRWKSRGGKSQKRKKIRKKIQAREKVENSRFTVVPEGPKAHKRSKIAHRCSEKQISKSKWSKHLMLGPLLQVALSKECIRQWREARFEVKILKNTTRPHHFWKLGFRKSVKSHTLASSLMLSASKIQKFSQNAAFLMLSTAKFEGCLAGELRFSFSTSKSQGCLAEWLRFQACR